MSIIEKVISFTMGNLLIFLVVKSKYKKLPSSIPGYYNAVTVKNFYRIVLSNLIFFKEEQANIQLIKRKYLNLKNIIPEYEYFSILNNRINIMKGPRMFPLSSQKEMFEHSRNILQVFAGYGRELKSNITDFPYLLKGFELAINFCNEDICKDLKHLVEDFLHGNDLRIGPCHGDFHHKNIMSFKGKVYIIDLDCFRKRGIQALDAIYFISQYIVESERVSWPIALINMLSNERKYFELYKFLGEFMDISLCSKYVLVYFFDRLGQDFKYLHDICQLPQNDLVNTINFLSDLVSADKGIVKTSKSFNLNN